MDYYVTGHSLGGRLVQDVLYKIYKINRDLLLPRDQLNTPKHSATFNGFGYNKVVFSYLERDILEKYKAKLTNFYYINDMVGHAFGDSIGMKHSGTDSPSWGKDINDFFLEKKTLLKSSM